MIMHLAPHSLWASLGSHSYFIFRNYKLNIIGLQEWYFKKPNNRLTNHKFIQATFCRVLRHINVKQKVF